MNSNLKYWLTQARWGLIVAIGAALAVYSFRRGQDGFGLALVAGTLILAVLVYVFVDRKTVRQRDRDVRAHVGVGDPHRSS